MLRGLVAVVALAVAIAGAELALRLIDGQPLLAPALRPPSATDRTLAKARAHMVLLPVAAGVDRAWFELAPEPLPVPPDEPDLPQLRADYDRLGLPTWYEWNLAYLRELACKRRADFDQVYGGYERLFAFDVPGGGDPFPTFRFLRRAKYPSGLVTNGYGWRGPDLTLDKPPRTIRIAFVGASTTVSFHGSAASYPEFLGRWLNQWAALRDPGLRFEIINAAREGINSDSIAAIVRQEVLPLEPDLVVYYEGANQFWPASFIEWPSDRVPERPRLDPRTPWNAEKYSALLARVRSLWDGVNGRWSESERPVLPVKWPADLDERDPPLDHPEMPLNLPAIVQALESMRRDLDAAGGDLLVSSFFWMVYDGMKLDPVRNGNVLHYLHRVFWPLGYGHIGRMADFQNRVFAKYAATHGVPLLDFAALYPKDPDLFVDAIHMSPGGGTRLQAWVMMQLLLPMIERRIEDGSLPRPDRQPLDRHPAFTDDPRRFVSMSAIRQACAR